MSVESNILEVTGIKPQGPKEGLQAYLTRLAKAVKKVDDEDWETKLDNQTQLWANAAVAALDKEEEIAGFDGELSAADDGEEEEEEKEPAKPKKKAGKPVGKPAKKKAAADDDEEEEEPAKPKKKAAAAKSAKAPGGTFDPGGVKVQIKKLLIKDPSMPATKIIETLTKKGGSPSGFTVSGIRAEFRHSLRVLKMEGLLPDIEI